MDTTMMAIAKQELYYGAKAADDVLIDVLIKKGTKVNCEYAAPGNPASNVCVIIEHSVLLFPAPVFSL